jgi:predicted helicase
LCNQNQWNYARAKKELADGAWRQQAISLLYRPFDVRWTIRNSNVAVHRRERANNRLLKDNLAILLPKQTKDAWGCLVTDHVAAHKSASVYDPTSIAPLWLYADEDMLKGSIPARRPNLAPEFMEVITAAVGGGTPSPEDVFAYIYAMLYSPTYRSHFGDFLKRDFPRVPSPRSAATFAQLAALGHEPFNLNLGMNRVHPFHSHRPPRRARGPALVRCNSLKFTSGEPAVWFHDMQAGRRKRWVLEAEFRVTIR